MELKFAVRLRMCQTYFKLMIDTMSCPYDKQIRVKVQLSLEQEHIVAYRLWLHDKS